MYGLARYLVMYLTVTLVVGAMVLGRPNEDVWAQAISRCVAFDDRVECALAFAGNPIGSDFVIAAQYLSDGVWTDIGTDSSTTPYAMGTNAGYASPSSGTRSNITQVTVVGLDPDTTYTLRGLVYRLSGTTQTHQRYGIPTSVHTLPGLPEAPEQVSIERNDAGDEATVTWVAPDSIHDLTKYVIQRAELQRTSGVAVWGKEKFFETADGDTITYTDTGLDPDVTYQYQVAGVSSAGTGFYSATVRTLGAAGENDVGVDDRGYDAIPTPDHGQLPTGYDTSTGDAELVAAVDASITQMIGPTGLTWDPDKMRHFLVVLGAGVLAGMALVGNRKLGNRINGQSILATPRPRREPTSTSWHSCYSRRLSGWERSCWDSPGTRPCSPP